MADTILLSPAAQYLLYVLSENFPPVHSIKESTLDTQLQLWLARFGETPPRTRLRRNWNGWDGTGTAETELTRLRRNWHGWDGTDTAETELTRLRRNWTELKYITHAEWQKYRPAAEWNEYSAEAQWWKRRAGPESCKNSKWHFKNQRRSRMILKKHTVHDHNFKKHCPGEEWQKTARGQNDMNTIQEQTDRI